MIKKIVLTGGPCAGKTTALANIEQYLKELGYKVFIVSETATELINSGLSPIDKNGVGIVKFQEYVLKYQLQKEHLYEEIAANFPHDKIVIICDRGILDGKAFISDRQFNEILKQVSEELNIKLNSSDIINRYDMVIHLTTAARGNSKYYTLENNSARSETVDEAIRLDKKTVEAWSVHNNLQIIDSYEDFDEKITAIINVINNMLGNTFEVKKERKFQVKPIELDILSNINYEKTHIEQYYKSVDYSFRYPRNIGNIDEIRLRKVIYRDDVGYYYRVQSQENGVKKVFIETKLCESAFNYMLGRGTQISNVIKDRYTFIYNNQYFKLDKIDDICILEVVSKDKDIIDIPDCFEIIKEVTNDEDYKNINLGKVKSRQKILTF